MTDEVLSIDAKKSLQYSLRNIEVKEQYLNIPEDFDAKDKDNLAYSLIASVGRDKSLKVLGIQMLYEFIYKEQAILKLCIACEYKVPNVDELFDENDRPIERHQITDYLVAISLHQLRGIHALMIKNTKLDRLYIPLEPNRED